MLLRSTFGITLGSLGQFVRVRILLIIVGNDVWNLQSDFFSSFPSLKPSFDEITPAKLMLQID